MKVIADKKIPLIHDLFGNYAEVLEIPSHEINSDTVKDADILLVRSVTPIHQALLDRSCVKFVGSMTAGINHLDTVWLNNAGIHWGYAPGSNANAVFEYVMSCIAALISEKKVPEKLRVGVIGAGKIGSLIISQIQKFGFEILYLVPVRPFFDENLKSSSLDDFNSLDIITIHTPYTKSEPYSTHHLINEKFLNRQQSNCVLINTSRGAIIDEQALLQAEHFQLCLDVWEHEPNINLALLKKCYIATPHIAGYTEEAKLRASLMIYQELQKYYHLPDIKKSLLKLIKDPIYYESDSDWINAALKHYDPRVDTRNMKMHFLKNSAQIAAEFEKLRNNYQLRHEVRDF